MYWLFRLIRRNIWLIGLLFWSITWNDINLAQVKSVDSWTNLAPGIDQRMYYPSWLSWLYVVRIDPTLYHFRVHYHEGTAFFISEWLERLSNPIVVVNVNFFEPNHHILGMIFSDGVKYGETFQNRGGMFFIQDGIPNIESLIASPYQNEIYDQAIQAFPMLIVDQQQFYFDRHRDVATRRTVIAMDNDDNVLLIITPLGGITLLNLAQYLVKSDLKIVNALNLDGGGSSMMSINMGGNQPSVIVKSFDPVPSVLSIYSSHK